MIETQYLNDRYWRSHEAGGNHRADYWHEQRRQEAKKEEGCIKAPQSVVGGRFDVRG